jgi:hypothetical protein
MRPDAAILRRSGHVAAQNRHALQIPYASGAKGIASRRIRQFMDYVSRLVAVPTTSQKVTAFCLLYSAMAFILFPRTFLDVLGAYPIVRFYFFLPLLLAVGLCGAALLHSPKHPIQFMRWKLHDRGKGALITLLVLVISASAFTTLRHEYSFIVPFHADEVLADMTARTMKRLVARPPDGRVHASGDLQDGVTLSLPANASSTQYGWDQPKSPEVT